MPHNPENIIGEVLGKRAAKNSTNPSDNYFCPFIKATCPKRSTNIPDGSYPVCSIWKKSKQNKSEILNPEQDLICVCPKRFCSVDFINDVISRCWVGNHPKNPKIAEEVKMEGFGNVDFVIADISDNGAVEQFLSVELQAIDITGSVFPAYKALMQAKDLDKNPTYGLNWDNVYKRYITQLIRKGYYHHHWKSKIVAVIQEQVYRYIIDRADFLRTEDIKNPTTNIIFMTYKFINDVDNPGQFKLSLCTVEGTSHSNLQAAILYKDAPSRDVFCTQIKHSLSRLPGKKS